MQPYGYYDNMLLLMTSVWQCFSLRKQQNVRIAFQRQLKNANHDKLKVEQKSLKQEESGN